MASDEAALRERGDQILYNRAYVPELVLYPSQLWPVMSRQKSASRQVGKSASPRATHNDVIPTPGGILGQGMRCPRDGAAQGTGMLGLPRFLLASE